MNQIYSRSLQTIALILVVIGLIGLALGGFLTPVSRYVFAPLVGAQTWLSSRYQAIQNYFAAPQDMARLQQQNTELEARVAQLESIIIELNQQLAETKVLSALVDFARVHPENQYTAATVIGRDPSPFLQYIIINRGSDDGIRKGMPVVNAQGLVGRISAVTSGAARVQLVTDAASSINARLEPSGVQAELKGSVTGDLTLDMIPQSANVKSGDLVLTSGLGGNYPTDILVGQITGIRRRDYDLFQTATVQPVVDFNQLEIILVITNFRPVDISPLVPAPEAP